MVLIRTYVFSRRVLMKVIWRTLKQSNWSEFCFMMKKKSFMVAGIRNHKTVFVQ